MYVLEWTQFYCHQLVRHINKCNFTLPSTKCLNLPTYKVCPLTCNLLFSWYNVDKTSTNITLPKTFGTVSLKLATIRNYEHHTVGSYGMIGGNIPHILIPVLDGGKLASAWVCAINELREITYRLELGESGLSIFCSEEQNTTNLSDKIYSSKDWQILINLEFYR